ncbi:hypothetical protein ACTNDG_07125 [Clostridium sp. HCP1S3_B4]|uniref:hypothetical protein n=1 Tax=unclassified Clostridium TaxID=2614128 RepID=UPI003F8BA6D5
MKYMSLRKFLIDLFIEEINGDINISTKGGQSMFNSYYAAKRKTFLQILDFFKIDINSIKKVEK